MQIGDDARYRVLFLEHSDMQGRVAVPIKLYRTPDRVVIAAPMPGLRPEDVTVDVTETGRVILQSTPRGELRDEEFHVEVTVDRDGDQQVWTHEWWQEKKDVLLDEWCTCGYYRELDLPAAVDAALGTVTYGNGVLVVALPVTGEMRSARLRLAALGEGRGERVGIVGHQPARYIRLANAGVPPERMALIISTALSELPGFMQETFAAHCEVAQRLAGRMGLGEPLITCLGQVYERWDGRGLPRGLKGEDVASAVLLVGLAQDAVIWNRRAGGRRNDDSESRWRRLRASHGRAILRKGGDDPRRSRAHYDLGCSTGTGTRRTSPLNQ